MQWHLRDVSNGRACGVLRLEFVEDCRLLEGRLRDECSGCSAEVAGACFSDSTLSLAILVAGLGRLVVVARERRVGLAVFAAQSFVIRANLS